MSVSPPAHASASSPRRGTFQPTFSAHLPLASFACKGDILASLLRQNALQSDVQPMFTSIRGGLIPCLKETIPPRPLRVLFVENPDHYLQRNSDEGPFVSVGFLDPDVYARISIILPQSIRKTRVDPAGQVECLLASWLFLATEMIVREEIWEVSFIAWDTYLQIMLKGEEDRRWLALKSKTELIVGGLNYEGDFLNPKSPFQMNAEMATTYHQNCLLLLQKVTIWPHPPELLNAGQKLEMHNLLSIASIALNLEHPTTVPVEEAALVDLAHKIEEGDVLGVLDRGYSGWLNHRINKYTEDAPNTIREALVEQRKYWGASLHEFDQPRWFCQPYLPQLIHIGELRTFFVNGVFFYTVSTTPLECSTQRMVMMPAKFLRPLSKFSHDVEHPTSPKKTGWLTCDGEDIIYPLAYNIDDSFDKFVVDMMGQLVLAEEELYQAVSGLRIFGRCDVSVFRDYSGKYKYVVNKVSRSFSTSLFYTWAEPTGVADGMLVYLAQILQHVTMTKFLSRPPPAPLART